MIQEGSRKGGRLQVARFVHVADDALDGDVADCFAEEQLLDGGRSDGAESGQQQQKTPESERLSRVRGRHVAAQRQLSLVLQVDGRWDVA